MSIIIKTNIDTMDKVVWNLLSRISHIYFLLLWTITIDRDLNSVTNQLPEANLIWGYVKCILSDETIRGALILSGVLFVQRVMKRETQNWEQLIVGKYHNHVKVVVQKLL